VKRNPPKSDNIFVLLLILFIIFGLIFLLHQQKLKAPKPAGEIAFVIDDWGYNLNNVELLSEIKRPVTLAILPHRRYSEVISKKVKEDCPSCDIILHLPLESKSDRTPEPNTIRRNMQEEKVLSVLRGDIRSVPGIIGVSNHQGSKATENKELMKRILSELKRKNLFFLDSRTTPVSVCGNIAKKIGLRYAERDIFLDLSQKKDPEQYKAYVRKQMRSLVKAAKQKGAAIGIGHDKRLTLEVIKESIPDIEKEDIKIVPLKKLVR
jgi:polysaccharide deacetylase 2 family uncharacterized protein YibQ